MACAAGILAVNAQAQTTDAVPAPAASATAAAPTATAPAFDVFEFEVEGNTVLAVEAIERAVTPFLGPAGGMAKVEAARAALEQAYQQAGYLTVFVDIPEQRVDEGVVRLKAVEGRVDRLRVIGARYFSQGVIRQSVPELAIGATPNFNTVQKQLAGLNRSDERSVQPVLRAGLVPGTVEVDLQVKDRLPAEASLEINNKHPAATRNWRLTATGRYNNLWQRGHSLGLTLTTAPEDPRQSQVAVVNYTVPLSGDNSLALYAVSSNSLVEPLTSVSVAGKGTTAGLRYLVPLPALDGYTHLFSLGVDYKDFRTRVATGDSGLLTPLRYAPAQLAYNAQLQSGEFNANLNTQAVFALRGILARQVDCAGSQADQFTCSGQGTDGSFGYWRGDLRVNRAAWAGSQVGLRLGWQFSAEPLVGNERFVLGGVDTVRGYLESEASGDRGLLGSLEWRSANLGGAKGWLQAAWLDEWVAYAFADAGQINVLNALAEQPRHIQLRSVGFGLSWRAGKQFSGAFDVGRPLNNSSATRAGSTRVHVRLAYAL